MIAPSITVPGLGMHTSIPLIIYLTEISLAAFPPTVIKFLGRLLAVRISGAREVRTQALLAGSRQRAGAWWCWGEVWFQLELEQSRSRPQPPLSATAVFVNKEPGEESYKGKSESLEETLSDSSTQPAPVDFLPVKGRGRAAIRPTTELLQGCSCLLWGPSPNTEGRLRAAARGAVGGCPLGLTRARCPVPRLWAAAS